MQLLKQFGRNCLEARVYVPFLATLAWAASMLWLPASIPRAILSAAYLTFVPGYVLYRTLVGYPRGEVRARALGYVVGLSMIVLMLLGLGINQILPILGYAEPLNAFAMTVVIAGFSLLFTLLSACRRSNENIRRFASLARRAAGTGTFWSTIVASVAMLLIPVLAVGGAITLNNGGSNAMALAAVGFAAFMTLVLVWTNKPRLLALYPLGLFSLALTLLLGTSMRGWEITGHDIMQEFQVFQLTSQHSLWSMGFYQDAYTACLSITILPTIFQKLTGIYDPYVFKLLFQIIFAMLMPALYAGLRAHVPRKTAFLTVLAFITFPTFLTDIMMLNRQEIAIFCFALSLLVALDRQLKPVARHLLMIIFLGGMVLSHYSTSYIAASVLLVALCLGIALHILRPLLGKLKMSVLREQHFSLYPPYIVVLVLAMVVGWSGFATHTAGNISQTIEGIRTAIVERVNPAALPKPRLETVVAKDGSLSAYIDTVEHARTLPAQEYYDDAVKEEYATTEIPQSISDVTPPLRVVGVSAEALNTVYSLIRQGYVVLLAGLLAIGLALMAWKRTATRIPTQYALLGAACLIVVALQVVLPSDAVNYGLARVIQQGLVILALPAVIAAIWLLGKFRVTFTARFRAVGVALVILLVLMSGMLSTLTGGFKPALAFSNDGFYYEAYYTHAAEIQAGNWLVAETPQGSRVYADEFARRKLITYAGIFAEPTLIPTVIPRDSYVYLSQGNVSFNEVPVYQNGQLLFYNVPYHFLTTHKSLLYNSGGVLIYK